MNQNHKIYSIKIPLTKNKKENLIFNNLKNKINQIEMIYKKKITYFFN